MRTISEIQFGLDWTRSLATIIGSGFEMAIDSFPGALGTPKAKSVRVQVVIDPDDKKQSLSKVLLCHLLFNCDFAFVKDVQSGFRLRSGTGV